MRKPKKTLPEHELVPETPMPCAEEGCTGALRRRKNTPRIGGYWYACDAWPETGCSAAIGCHEDGRPLGVPGTADTRAARKRAHTAFDRLWKDGHMSRSQAYRRMRDQVGLSHIGDADAETCEQIIEWAEELLSAIAAENDHREDLALFAHDLPGDW